MSDNNIISLEYVINQCNRNMIGSSSINTILSFKNYFAYKKLSYLGIVHSSQQELQYIVDYKEYLKGLKLLFTCSFTITSIMSFYKRRLILYPVVFSFNLLITIAFIDNYLSFTYLSTVYPYIEEELKFQLLKENIKKVNTIDNLDSIIDTLNKVNNELNATAKQETREVYFNRLRNNSIYYQYYSDLLYSPIDEHIENKAYFTNNDIFDLLNSQEASSSGYTGLKEISNANV